MYSFPEPQKALYGWKPCTRFWPPEGLSRVLRTKKAVHRGQEGLVHIMPLGGALRSALEKRALLGRVDSSEAASPKPGTLVICTLCPIPGTPLPLIGPVYMSCLGVIKNTFMKWVYKKWEDELCGQNKTCRFTYKSSTESVISPCWAGLIRLNSSWKLFHGRVMRFVIWSWMQYRLFQNY